VGGVSEEVLEEDSEVEEEVVTEVVDKVEGIAFGTSAVLGSSAD